jgi:hypothetical protein
MSNKVNLFKPVHKPMQPSPITKTSADPKKLFLRQIIAVSLTEQVTLPLSLEYLSNLK